MSRRKAIAGALAACVLAAVAAAAWFLWRGDQHGLEPRACEPERRQDCEVPRGVAPEQALAEKHAPIVQLKEQGAECDRSGAGFEPLPVEAILGNPSIRLRMSDGHTITAPSAGDLYELDQAYLDFPGDPRRPGCRYERDGRRFGDGHDRVAYARVVVDGEYGRLALQYWFFYYFNDWNNKHEGDWEMIQLTFDAVDARAALQVVPHSIGFSQHSSGEVREWPEVVRETHRPVVFVAVGSHAGFFAPHIYLGRGEASAGFGCDDASEPGRRLPLRVRMLPESVVDAQDPYAWITFRGRWGQLVGAEFDGPTGPNMKRQWSEPFAWEDDLRSASVRVPSREFAGPSAVNAFCDAVLFLSDHALPIILRLPYAVAGGGAILLIAAAGALTRTRYLPLFSQPLRARRRIGQILLVSANVYRRHARVFIGIGLTFVPVAVAVSVFEWLLFALTPVGDVINLSASNAGERAILALALGAAEFGAAYALVIAATITALSSVEKGVAPSVKRAWRNVATELARLAPARIVATAVVGVLMFTIVALPVALRYAVRWAFVEHAVLLDRRWGHAALAYSSRTVGRDWWWAAAAVLGLGMLGLCAAPMVGIALLLAAPGVSLAVVNFAAAAVYVLLVPYVGIAYTLIYFDLQSREDHLND